MAPSLWAKVSWLPGFARRIIGRLMTSIPIHLWDTSMSLLAGLLRKDKPFNQFGDKVHKFGGRLSEVHSEDDLFLHLISEPNSEKLVLHNMNSNHVKTTPAFLTDPLPQNGVEDFALRMMYKDTLNYLTDDILCKVDRASMGVSLETRVPFLDHKIVELAWRMPLKMKINDTTGKSILRNILYKHVPKKLIERPKAGFSIPLSDWLKGPLKDWAETLLDKSRLEKEGNLNADYVQLLWSEHIMGKRNWTFKLWSILMFQSWLDSSK
tara:strand:+ start:13 stop:810 length:798 start_codon:yes stop_codon:yes gene_type:complete